MVVRRLTVESQAVRHVDPLNQMSQLWDYTRETPES